MASMFEGTESAPGAPPSALGVANDLVLWREPLKTGLLFAVGNLAFFLINFRGYTVLQLVSYVAILLLSLSFAFVNAKALIAHFQHTAPPARTPSQGVFLSASTISSNANLIADTVNRALNRVLDVAWATDNVTTAKTIAALFGLVVLNKIISLSVLLHLTFVLAFTWPTVYRMFKTQIDTYVDLAKKQALALVHKIPIPPALLHYVHSASALTGAPKRD